MSEVVVGPAAEVRASDRAAVRGRFPLFRISDVLQLPDPEWLIEGLLEAGAFGVMYGPSGDGKSFVALDWALSVATGRSWAGRGAKKGPVVYVAAEGGRGIKRRVAAWLSAHDLTSEEAFFVLEAVQFREDQDYSAFHAQLQSHCAEPALIVIDTFARCFVGGDENQSKEVGHFIETLRKLQIATNAAIVLVHHTGKNKGAERGSSALRAAADAMFKVSRESKSVVVVENDKQKDSEEASDVHLWLEDVQVLATNGSLIRSCVLVPTQKSEGDRSRVRLNAAEKLALDVLAVAGPCESGVWRAAVEKRRAAAVKTKTFDNWRKALVEKGLVAHDALTKRYSVTAAGAMLSTGSPEEKKESGTSQLHASHATPPIGVAGRRERSRLEGPTEAWTFYVTADAEIRRRR